MSHPPAQKHGALVEVLPDVFFVTGTFAASTLVRFGRNMTVVRRGGELVIVNSVRLDDRGLAALDKLGKVTHVIRLAGNHGMDDPFYAEHYGAKVWVVKGQKYSAFTPHHEMDVSTELPISGAKLYQIDARLPEGLLVLAEHGGTVIAGDCLQNWAKPDENCSFVARIAMRPMGFIRPYNIGPAWFKNGKPPKGQLRGILDLTFANVVPAHGTPVIGNARELYRPRIDALASGA
jgi:hypothetical protein